MSKKYSLSVFIFRRDLRLFDNTALIAALEQSEHVIPCFIFDPQQITDKNKYKSDNALEFMLESIEDLQQQLKKHSGHLYLFYGKPYEIVDNILRAKKIDAVFAHYDYTPYSSERDSLIQKTCDKLGVDFKRFHDSMLHEPNALLSEAGKPYTIFTAYFKKAFCQPVPQPKKNNHKNYYTHKVIPEYFPRDIFKDLNNQLFVHGGTKNGEKILKSLDSFKNYENTRDFPGVTTTGLSAHNKFGTISIRQEFYAIKEKLGISHGLIRQLFWRDFYMQVADHFPHVFGHNFNKKYDHIHWQTDRQAFNRWCSGTTGFPLVDAGMRQLNSTGWMHNRVRMVVASFLTKDLHIDWRLGERYFAQKLVDYDPAINNGNWQWAASTGCDAQPYFRIFNPWLQQKKFDPQCTYIKQWVPELSGYSPQVIHSLHSGKSLIPHYPQPIVDHAKQAHYAKKMFLKHNS